MSMVCLCASSSHCGSLRDREVAPQEPKQLMRMLPCLLAWCGLFLEFVDVVGFTADTVQLLHVSAASVVKPVVFVMVELLVTLRFCILNPHGCSPVVRI